VTVGRGATVVVRVDAGRRRPRRSEVGLLCVERARRPVAFLSEAGEVHQTAFWRARVLFEDWCDMPPRAPGPVPVAIPASGPFSYAGENVTVEWLLQLRGHGPFLSPVLEEVPLWVMPGPT
jgi:hypothetical protein